MLRDYFTQDFQIGLMVFCLMLVVASSQLFSARFVDFISVIWNDKYTKLYIREQKKLDIFNAFFLANLVISGGIFIIISIKYYNITLNNEPLWLIFISCLLVIFFILRILVERTIGYFFDIPELLKHYLFRKVTYRNLSGLVFIITNTLLMFTSLNKEVLIYTTLAIVVIINSIGFFRFVKDYQKVIISHLFYFLLYLCALEIGPYVILYKVIKDYFG